MIYPDDVQLETDSYIDKILTDIYSLYNKKLKETIDFQQEIIEKLYSKIPKYKNKANYEFEMRKKIKSDKPSLPLTIIKIRVLKQSEIQNIETKG